MIQNDGVRGDYIFLQIEHTIYVSAYLNIQIELIVSLCSFRYQRLQPSGIGNGIARWKETNASATLRTQNQPITGIKN